MVLVSIVYYEYNSSLHTIQFKIIFFLLLYKLMVFFNYHLLFILFWLFVQMVLLIFLISLLSFFSHISQSSFLVSSIHYSHSIHTGYLIPYNETPTPSQMYCILASSNEVFLCSLQFGNMKIESLEFESPSLLLLSSSFFLSTDSNSVSFYQLSLASDRQKYLVCLFILLIFRCY